jgi:EmrB/QacA subfamily drug resistance transporter
VAQRAVPLGDVDMDSRRAAVAARRAARRAAHPTIALAVIVTCQLMLILDATIVNIALPNIQRSLHFSATGLSWVVSAYSLAFGGLLLLGGRAGDILGRRRNFVIGIGLFTVASLLGGFATSAAWLLATRAAQGVGAAIAAPSALSLLMTTFEEGPARTRALSIFSAVSAGGASIGLIAGGMLTDWASWRWVLFVNVPIGLAIVVLAPIFLNETERNPGRFDLTGALTSTFGVAGLVYGFIRAATEGWGDRITLGSFVAAVVLLTTFVVVELRASQPIVPLRLLANRNRSSAYLNMLILAATMYGTFFFITQFVQDVVGFSPVKAGFAFLPLSGAIFTFSRLVPRLLPRFGPKPLMVTGGVLITAGMVWLTRISEDTGYLSGLIGPLVLFGIGAGLSFTPLTVMILSGVERHNAGAASGLLQAMQQVGGSLGVAILVTRFGIVSRDAARHPLANATPKVQAHHVMAEAMGSAFTLSAIFAVLVLLIALFAIKTRGAASPRQPVFVPAGD